MRRSVSSSRCSARASSRAPLLELDAVVGHRRLELRDARRRDEAVLQQAAVGLQFGLLVRAAIRSPARSARAARRPPARPSPAARAAAPTGRPTRRGARRTARFSLAICSATRGSAAGGRDHVVGKAQCRGRQLLGFEPRQARAFGRHAVVEPVQVGVDRRRRRAPAAARPARTRWPSRTLTSRTVPPSACCTGAAIEIHLDERAARRRPTTAAPARARPRPAPAPTSSTQRATARQAARLGQLLGERRIGARMADRVRSRDACSSRIASARVGAWPRARHRHDLRADRRAPTPSAAARLHDLGGRPVVLRRWPASSTSILSTCWISVERWVTTTTVAWPRSAFSVFGQRRFAGAVEVGVRLVEDHQLGVAVQRTRQRDALALPGREQRAVRVDHGVVALGQREDQLVHLRPLARRARPARRRPRRGERCSRPRVPGNSSTSCGT